MKEILSLLGISIPHTLPKKTPEVQQVDYIKYKFNSWYSQIDILDKKNPEKDGKKNILLQYLFYWKSYADYIRYKLV